MDEGEFIKTQYPLPWTVKKFEDHGYQLYYIFDADGEIIDLENSFVLNFTAKACNG